MASMLSMRPDVASPGLVVVAAERRGTADPAGQGGGASPARPPPPPHLARLEAEAIGILREVAAACRRPMLLTSLGKDSSVLLHLARKAFFPGRLPFPLLHVDTGWKFRAMLE